MEENKEEEKREGERGEKGIKIKWQMVKTKD